MVCVPLCVSVLTSMKFATCMQQLETSVVPSGFRMLIVTLPL